MIKVRYRSRWRGRVAFMLLSYCRTRLALPTAAYSLCRAFRRLTQLFDGAHAPIGASHMSRHLFAVCAATVFAFTAVPASAQSESIPRYEHIIVIIAENHGYDQIIHKANAPNINTLAQKYGLATDYYGVVHPSKANY